MTKAYDPDLESLYDIKGDVDIDGNAGAEKFDLNGPTPGGMVSHIGLGRNREARVNIRYKDRIAVADVYLAGGELSLVLYCWKCENTLRISSTRKAIDWDPVEGIISVEPFQCTWEIGRGTDATRNDRIAYGMGLCGLKVAIDRNVAKDA